MQFRGAGWLLVEVRWRARVEAGRRRGREGDGSLRFAGRPRCGPAVHLARGLLSSFPGVALDHLIPEVFFLRLLIPGVDCDFGRV
jgi:hypothetical protein